MKTFWTNTRWFNKSVDNECSKVPISAVADKYDPLLRITPSIGLSVPGCIVPNTPRTPPVPSATYSAETWTAGKAMLAELGRLASLA